MRVFAPRRRFSQLVTSFFASESLGIPHAPFSAFLFSFRLSSDLAALLAVSFPLAVPLDSSVRLLFFLVSLTLM